MWIDETFPNLTYDITSEPDEVYNCIAWAMDSQNAWWSHLPGYRWLGDRSPSIESLVTMFLELGYELSENDDVEPAFDKVALYARNGRWTHAARQLRDGRWTSKLGMLEDIEHTTPQDLSGSLYGELHCVMKKRHDA